MSWQKEKKNGVWGVWTIMNEWLLHNLETMISASLQMKRGAVSGMNFKLLILHLLRSLDFEFIVHIM